MIAAVLLLSLFHIGLHIFTAFMWRQNQNLHRQLLRVTAKSAVPHAVVQEVAPSLPRRTEELDERVKQQRAAARELWRV